MSVYKSHNYFLVLSRESKHFCHTLVLDNKYFHRFFNIVPSVTQVVVQVSFHHEMTGVIVNVQVHIRTLHCTRNEVFH